MIHVIERFNPLGRAKGIYYGWWMVGFSALIMALTSVPLFQGMTVWFPVIEKHFGWNRAAMVWAFSLTRIEGGIMGPIDGILIDRLGPRRMVLIGCTILGVGFVALGSVNEIWHLYLAFMVMSIGAGMGTWLPIMSVLNNWFVRRRATAMAGALEGYAVGGIFLIPLLAWAVEAELMGDVPWRTTAWGIGVFIIVLAFPISRLVRNRPEDYGQLPDGDMASAAGTPEVSKPLPQTEAGRGYTWQEAIRTRTFWLISIGHGCSSIVIITITVHLGQLINIDRGFSLQTVGWVVATQTAVVAVFTLVGGYVGDRVPIRMALFGFSAMQSVAVLVLLHAHSVGMFLLFAVLLGMSFGGRNPLTTAIRGVYFGRRRFASITGMSMAPMNVMLFGAPLFAGYMFEYTGSYDIPFYTIAVICFVGSGLFLLLGEPDPSLQSKRKP